MGIGRLGVLLTMPLRFRTLLESLVAMGDPASCPMGTLLAWAGGSPGHGAGARAKDGAPHGDPAVATRDGHGADLTHSLIVAAQEPVPHRAGPGAG